MIGELELIVLTHDMDEYNLQAGDVGAVVHCYEDELAYEVEFVTAEGRTVALLTLTNNDVRPIQSQEILHVRDLAA